MLVRARACRVPWPQMARAVMRLDPAALRSAEDVHALLACVPTPEEAALFGAFLRSGGDAAALSDAERFCLELMAVSASLIFSVGFSRCCCCCPVTLPKVLSHVL